MGLSSALARLAGRHVRVLLVHTPGQWQLRVEVERIVLSRGWQLAASPAGADMLIVCGVVAEDMESAVDVTWSHMPGPRVRVDLAPGEDAASRLAQATTVLLDTAHQVDDAAQREKITDLLQQGNGDPHDVDDADMDHGQMTHDDTAADHGHMDHETGDTDHSHMDHDAGSMDHSHMDHGQMTHDDTAADHGHMDHDHMDHDAGSMDHSHMDHGDMEMAPGGLALAEGGSDRDGLEMDVLHLPLGPVLVHWPAGLVVRCSLQGDVIVNADVELLGGRDDVSSPLIPARWIDDAVSLLALVGWEDAATRGRLVRDLLLDEASRADTRLMRFDRRIRRSRILRWSLRGLGLVEGLDAYDRLLRMLDRAHGRDVTVPGPSTTGELAAHMIGVDLAAARLIVASFDLDRLMASDPSREATHA